MDDMWVFKRLEVKCILKGPIGQLCGLDQEDNYCCWICSRLDECARRWKCNLYRKVGEEDGSIWFCPRGKPHWCSVAFDHWKWMQRGMKHG